mmetsp:Transcript_9455/g.38642  ORF Transcript_9455/g.38642 Transcript_9455/m.38642 type:complete len:213 (-) Transcript_9455:447-1085(-)
MATSLALDAPDESSERRHRRRPHRRRDEDEGQRLAARRHEADDVTRVVLVSGGRGLILFVPKRRALQRAAVAPREVGGVGARRREHGASRRVRVETARARRVAEVGDPLRTEPRVRLERLERARLGAEVRAAVRRVIIVSYCGARVVGRRRSGAFSAEREGERGPRRAVRRRPVARGVDEAERGQAADRSDGGSVRARPWSEKIATRALGRR